MEKIFLSYRWDDSHEACNHIYDALIDEFGADNVFLDNENIQVGANIKKRIRESLAQCKIQLVVIGQKWVNIRDKQGKRRLDDPKDLVRFEIETALNSNLTVIPVLVDGAPLPSPDQLPKGSGFPFGKKGLAELPLQKGIFVRTDDEETFDADMIKLITEIRAVIAPGTQPSRKAVVYHDAAVAGRPLRDRVTADLCAGGVLHKRLPNYEERPEQIKMAQLVADAIESNQHIVIEAGTGTGKSLAYLLPIVRSGKVAIVSTANKTLQDQLFDKDIPFVRKTVRRFNSALVKGMGNYLCLDRLREEITFQQLVHDAAFAQMLQLVENAKHWDGDLDKLPIGLSSTTRSRVNADSDLCAWRSCPYYGDCFVRQMRETARSAQVIVVNHTLLLLDAALGGFLLPERDIVIIDEAHHLEDEATQVFTTEVSPGRIRSLLSQKRLVANVDAALVSRAQEANTHLWDILSRIGPYRIKGRQPLQQPVQEGVRLANIIDELASNLSFRRPPTMDDKEEQLYEKLLKRTRNLAEALGTVFSVDRPEELVYYLEYVARSSHREPELNASAAPLSVTEILRQNLFDKCMVVATSATLAVGHDFSHFCERVGLPKVQAIVLDQTFNYAKNALLYVPRMRQSPAYDVDSGPYLDELAGEMVRLVHASNGRAFLLFSSQNALRGIYERVHSRLEVEGFSLIVQGQDLGRIEMVRKFRDGHRAILFGLKSFWEGVDIAGEALSLVVIDKMPFSPPNDPIHQARVNRMKQNGEDWFNEYVLAEAVLQLRQGIGRLLRTRDDRGVMAVLDNRLYTKNYGQRVFNSLPRVRHTDSIIDVQAFFNAQVF